jgi:hypothetical protein
MSLFKNSVKTFSLLPSWVWWIIPVIPAAWEVEVGVEPQKKEREGTKLTYGWRRHINPYQTTEGDNRPGQGGEALPLCGLDLGPPHGVVQCVLERLLGAKDGS